MDMRAHLTRHFPPAPAVCRASRKIHPNPALCTPFPTPGCMRRSEDTTGRATPVGKPTSRSNHSGLWDPCCHSFTVQLVLLLSTTSHKQRLSKEFGHEASSYCSSYWRASARSGGLRASNAHHEGGLREGEDEMGSQRRRRQEGCMFGRSAQKVIRAALPNCTPLIPLNLAALLSGAPHFLRINWTTSTLLITQ